jgi:hypothetical protein
MFSHVLFATDLFEASDLALDCVAGWKNLGLSKVTIAHVHAIRYVGGAEGLEDRLRSDHAPKLERQAQRVRDAGVSASWRLEFGVPYLDIERIAREEGAEAPRRSAASSSSTRPRPDTRCCSSTPRAPITATSCGTPRKGPGESLHP